MTLTAHLRADPELREALAAALVAAVTSTTLERADRPDLFRASAREILDRLTSENSEGETT